MQFSGIKIFYKSIGDIKKLIFLSRGKLKGEKMSLEVKKVDNLSQAQQPVSAENTAKKAELEKEKVDKELQTALLGSKKAQKERKEELKAQYMKDLGMSNKEAKEAAKSRLDDEVAGERIGNTDVYYNKDEYKEAKKTRDEEYDKLYKQYRDEGKKRREAKKLANAEAGEVEYIKSKKVRKFVDTNKEKFFDKNGTFNQDSYKEEIKEWSGDNKLDLSESRAAGKQYDVKSRTIRKAAKYANFDVQKDKTALKRLGHVAESVGIGAAAGAGVGAILGPHMKTKGLVKMNETFTSTVIDKTTGQVVDKIVTKRPVNVPVEDKIGAARGALFGALTGGAAGLGIGLATMHKVKDQGEKDVFNGISAEEVVKEAGKGVEGTANQKLVDGILKMENLTDEQKVNLLKKHYGENTGKRVTQRELLAAYEEAKKLNDVKPVVHTTPTPSPLPQPAPISIPTPAPVPPHIDPLPQKEPCEVIVQNGESISRLAKKYGVSEKEIIELNRKQLKTFKHAKNCDDNRNIYGFLVGAKIKVNNGCDQAYKNKTSEEAIKDYNKMVEKHIDEYCEEHKVYSQAFKKQVEAKRRQNAA